MTNATKKDSPQRLQEIEDFNFVASDARGQRVLRRIIEQTGLFRLSFAGESTHATAFSEGTRNVGLFLNDEIIAICPEKWIVIMKGK